MARAIARKAFYLAMAAFLTLALPAAPPPAAAMPHTSPVQIAGGSINTSPSLPASTSQPPIEFVDNFGGSIATFAISGTIAFLIQGYALTVFDISAPAAPIRIGHMPVVWGATTLTVANGIVYIASDRIVQIIDARNPALPIEITRFQARDYVNSIRVVGTTAYLLGNITGVEIIDISDLSRPIHLAQYAPSNCCTDFLAVGNLAYVPHSNVLTILDISNPRVPVTRGSFTLAIPTQTIFWRVMVEGTRAYIEASTRDPSLTDYPRFVTLDITHPENPLLLGNVELPSWLVTIAGNIAYMTSDSQLQLFDVSDPAHPVAHGAYAATLPPIFVQIVLAGSRAYLLDRLGALRTLDVSNPDHPVLLGSYTTPPALGSYSIQIVGDTGYLLSQGFQVIDLTNPISPTLRGHYLVEYPLSAHVFGGHAYLSTVANQLELLDISNPDLPTRISTMEIGTVTELQEVNNRVYLLTGVGESCGKFCSFYHHSLTIMDISNPSAPQILSRIQLFDKIYYSDGSVLVKDTFAYVGWGDALRIIDVSNPAAPVVRTSYGIPGGADFIQGVIVGNICYIANGSRLVVLDLTDPAKPTLLGQIGTTALAGATNIQVQGNLAFVYGTQGVLVFDISDPTRPIPRASYANVSGPGQAIGNLIYVAGGFGGLYVLRLHPDRFPPPMFMPLARH